MDDAGTLTMSAKELNRPDVLSWVEGRLAQCAAAEQLGLSLRQVERLCRTLRDQGAGGLASRKRGRPSNRKLPAAARARATDLVRTHYADLHDRDRIKGLIDPNMLVEIEATRSWTSESGAFLGSAFRRL